MERIVVGMSGGVDSSVAALLLRRQGYDVVGVFMKNWDEKDENGTCTAADDWNDVQSVCDTIGIPCYAVNFEKEYYDRVFSYFLDEYRRGRTPNPDVLCNREIKFDVFLREALKLGADYVATGHYCRREVTETAEGPVYRLLAGSDPNKDQSYFLCQLTQEQLSRALFPIGHLLKPEVRRIAAEQHLATAQRKDSQGICFVGKVDLPVFLQQQLKAREGAIVEIPASWPGYALRGRIAAPGERSTAWELPADGPFSQEQLDALAEPYRYTPEAGRQAGTHRGAHFFTIGQRKGLGVGGYAEPLFVIASDVEHNVLYVGMGQEHPGLYRRALRILPEEMHWIRPDRALQPGGSARFSMRIRYRQPLQGGVLHVTEQGGYIVFDRPQRGVTAGQFAAWYDGDELVGSGVIHR